MGFKNKRFYKPWVLKWVLKKSSVMYLSFQVWLLGRGDRLWMCRELPPASTRPIRESVQCTKRGRLVTHRTVVMNLLNTSHAWEIWRFFCGTRERTKITLKNSCSAYTTDKFVYARIKGIKLKCSDNSYLFHIASGQFEVIEKFLILFLPKHVARLNSRPKAKNVSPAQKKSKTAACFIRFVSIALWVTSAHG